jgi:hypothetical protein
MSTRGSTRNRHNPYRRNMKPTAAAASSYSRLSPRQARAVFVAVALLTAFLLTVAPPSLRDLPEDTAKPGDVDLYKAEVDRIRAGEDYYTVASQELVARGYPTRSVFNWRTPLPMWLIGKMPASMLGKLLLAGLALAVLLLAFEGISREEPKIFRRAVPLVVLMIGPFLPCLLGKLYVMPVIWAGTLLALSLCAYGVNWRWLGVAAGLTAPFFRELALPYCLLAAALAWRERRRGELLAWTLGIAAWAAFFGLHWLRVSPLIASDAVAHREGWIQLAGARFVLATTQANAYLLLLPVWATVLYFVAAIFGIAGWQTPLGRRAAFTVCLFVVAFAFVGQRFNQYWGMLTAPLLCLGVVRAPQSFFELWRAADLGTGGARCARPTLRLRSTLNMLLLCLLPASAAVALRGQIFVAGCDITQFYSAGQLVNRGLGDFLYSKLYLQYSHSTSAASFLATSYYSPYPPIMAVLAAPWARLPISLAQMVWWGCDGAAFCLAGWMLYRSRLVRGRWRLTAVLAMAAMFPAWIALRVGQPTPLWLLSILGGIILHSRGRCVAAGAAWSILAMKPQLAAPLLLWLLLRRDGRALGGVLLGVAVQTAVVMAVLGPAMPLRYLLALPQIAGISKITSLSPAYEHSFAEMLNRAMLYNGWTLNQRLAVSAPIQAVIGVALAALLLQIILAGGRLQKQGVAPPCLPRYEYAAAVLFMVLATPHFLLFDVTLLIVPIVCLWSTPAWRLGLAMYPLTTVAAPLVFLALGYSLVPFVALWVLYRLGREVCSLATAATNASFGKDAVGYASA